jgi:hypothetical protein
LASQHCRCNLRDMKRHPARVEKETNGCVPNVEGSLAY